MLFDDKIVLITGGTGSFGEALLQRLLNTGIQEIRVFSRDEKKQHDMRVSLNHPRLSFYIGDTRNYQGLEHAMRGVDYVFHAAALKQVPSCEFFPMEATLTNVIGTDHVIRSAITNKVKKVVCLSTDKAAYPINAMGMTKALMEKVAIAASRHLDESETLISLTRYGNVIGSRGSVLPLFRDQIMSGKPLTITDPLMTRFMMTMDEAIDLVFFAFQNAQQGDLFIQKAPACKLEDLATAMLGLYNKNNEIHIIGTRHGEKLYETLVTREEMARAEDLGQFFRIPADNRELNYGQFFTQGNPETKACEDFNSHNAQQLNIDQITQLLQASGFGK